MVHKSSQNTNQEKCRITWEKEVEKLMKTIEIYVVYTLVQNHHITVTS